MVTQIVLRRLVLVLTAIMVTSTADRAMSEVHVKGYYRKDGTYVRPHYRSDPDGIFGNNWSTIGNVNPHTGKLGTRVTPPAKSGDGYFAGTYQSGSDRSAIVVNPYQPSAIQLHSNNEESNFQAARHPVFDAASGEFLLNSAAWNEAELLEKLGAINYREIDFSTAESELREILPNARLNKDHVGSDKGINTYELKDDPTSDCVLLRFFDDALVEIDLIYFPKRVASNGGAKALAMRSAELFGEPTKKLDGATLWDFPGIDRIVVSSYEDGKWSLHIYHRSRRMGITDYRDTSVDPEISPIRVSVGFAVPYIKNTASPVPAPVLEAINARAEKDHPLNVATQDWVVGRQIRAYRELQKCPRPSGMSDQIFSHLQAQAARDHPSDYSTQLYVIRRQKSAFQEFENFAVPTGVAGSHFFALKRSATRRHPGDYSTQLYVLKRYIDEYLLYRQAGNSGETILRYLLRYE